MAKFIPPTLEEMRQFKKAENLNLVDVDFLFTLYTKLKWHDTKGEPIKNWKNKLHTHQCFQEKKQGIKNSIIKREELNRKEKVEYSHTLFSKEMTEKILPKPKEPEREPIWKQVKKLKQEYIPQTIDKAIERKKQLGLIQ